MKRVIIFLIVILIGGLVAWAGSQGGKTFNGWPVFLLAAAWAFAVNWLVFIPSAAAQTEKYYDLTGSFTYISTIGLALFLSAPNSPRAIIVAALVSIWAVRLGSFLFMRISRDGHDSRFDALKVDPIRFLITWTLQGLWVVLTSACALAIITSTETVGLDLFFWIGLAVWVIGFSLEVTADRQKSAFKTDPKNQGKFINSGLWAWSRHPNYFGEIVLWTGIAIMALPILTGWQWVCLISPIFVTLLLTKVSGIPLLTKKAKEKWGNDPDWKAYFENTPALIPRKPRQVSIPQSSS